MRRPSAARIAELEREQEMAAFATEAALDEYRVCIKHIEAQLDALNAQWKYELNRADDAERKLDAVLARIAEAESQEPVAWFRYEIGIRIYYETKCWDDLVPLYARPVPSLIEPSQQEALKALNDLDCFFGSTSAHDVKIINTAKGIIEAYIKANPKAQE